MTTIKFVNICKRRNNFIHDLLRCTYSMFPLIITNFLESSEITIAWFYNCYIFHLVPLRLLVFVFSGV